MLIIPRQTKITKYAVIGAGPIGLAFLVELINRAQAHSKTLFVINVIEKRDLNFDRGQKLILIEDQTENKGISWIDFCKKHFFPGKNLTLDTEGNLLIDGAIPEKPCVHYAFIQKMLRQQDKSRYPVNVSIKKLQTNLLAHIKQYLPANVRINWHLNSTVNQIDMEKSVLTVSTATGSKELEFNTLVNCEGEKRQTVTLINQEIQKSKIQVPQFKYQALEARESYHMAIKIKIKEPESGTYNALIQSEREKYLKDNAKQKAVRDYLQSDVPIFGKEVAVGKLPFIFDPNLYKKHFYKSHWVPKYFVAGQIPKELHDMKDEQEKRLVLLELAQYLLAEHDSFAPELFTIDSKDQSEKALQKRATTFTSQVMAVDDPVRVLPNKSIIVVLGDACMSPLYFLGLSSTIGLNTALAFLDCAFASDNSKDPFQLLRTTFKVYQSYMIDYIKEDPFKSDEEPSHGSLGLL